MLHAWLPLGMLGIADGDSDVAALERIYDDSLIYTHSNGGVDNKSAYIGNIKSGVTKYQSMKREDIKVSVYGDAALVTSLR